MRKASVWGFLCVLVVVLAGTGFAQQQYGNIRGVVFEEGVGPLPGATVTLHSEKYGSRSAVSSANGIFRFINLFPETYSLRCELDGFTTYVREKLIIRVGINFDLEIVLKPQFLQEEVTVVAESPIVDTKSTATTVNVTWEKLQEIPSARDPWVILQQAPGIWVGTENVGGSNAGRMTSVSVKGSWTGGNVFNIDGVPITDMLNPGWSSRYFDFDSFDEMQIVTGGPDASSQVPGVSVNLITHRGGNRYSGNARLFYIDDSFQSDNRTQELKDLGYLGNRIERLWDYGAQFGGPILKNRLWFWLGYGVQDNHRLSIDGNPENYKVEGANAKVNWQIHDKNRLELSVITNGKTSEFQNVSPSRKPEASWDLWSNGSPFFKLEDEQTFSDNFLMSLKLAYTNQRWGADPRGGMDVQPSWDRFTGIYYGSSAQTKTWRPDFSGKIDGNLFLEDVWPGNHEIKFGFMYRTYRNQQWWKFPGDCLKVYRSGVPFYAYVEREWINDTSVDYLSLYISDILTLGRLALNLGLRLDREKGFVNETKVAASEIGPEILPAMTYPAFDPGALFVTFSPRIGLAYNLTGDGKTMIKASLARYSYQMATWVANHVNPAREAFALYWWNDTNGDDQLTSDELIGYPYQGIIGYAGFDPWDSFSHNSPNGIAQDLQAPLSDELMVGIERELFTDFSLRATLTLRRGHREYDSYYYDKDSGKIFTKDDYIGPYSGSLTYDGTTYEYNYWTLDQYRPAGWILLNNPGYSHNYTGLELAAQKRLSHRWMLNASFTWQKQIEHYGDDGYDDPTNVKEFYEGGAAEYSPEWMAKLSALYELPWGIKLSCFGNIRQGTIFNRYLEIQIPARTAVGLGTTTSIYIEKWGSARLPTVSNFDISLAKDFWIGDIGKVTVQVDAFNVFNFAHTLNKHNVINSPRYGEPLLILNPRVIRLGIRYQY